jgi:hypothetical protein
VTLVVVLVALVVLVVLAVLVALVVLVVLVVPVVLVVLVALVVLVVLALGIRMYAQTPCPFLAYTSFLIVGYSTSSVTQHRRLLNIFGYSTSSTLSTIEIRRLIKKIQDY